MEGLPRLQALVEEPSAIARLLRGVLRLQVERVRLSAAPELEGDHILDIDVPDHGAVSVLAEPFGPPTSEGHALRLRPFSRAQMSELFALVEALDEPSRTVPPPMSLDAIYDDDVPSHEDTIVDAHLLADATRSPFLGSDDSNFPPPRAVKSSVPTELPPQGVSLAPQKVPSIPAPPPDPRLGRLVAGRYRIDKLLGSGASAAVYQATHVAMQRAVAVKILHVQNQTEVQFMRRFRAEALAASKLEHVNVTRVFDYGQDDAGEAYIVMELVTGGSLEDLVRSLGRVPPRRAVNIAVQVCRALAFAHEAGIIHRDVKPENIMLVPSLDDDGETVDLVKVCDFGLAKLRDPDPEQGELTIAGMLCGSPAYMAPEQTTGDALDARADLYAVGVTLFEALTGQMPHEAHSLAELFMKKTTAAPRRLSTLAPDLPARLEEIVLRALATDREERPPTARALLGELRAVSAHLPD